MLDLLFPGIWLELQLEQYRVVFVLDLVIEHVLTSSGVGLLLVWKTWWNLIGLLLHLIPRARWINWEATLFQDRVANYVVVLIISSSENVWFVDLTEDIRKVNWIIVWHLFWLFLTISVLTLSCVWFLMKGAFVEGWWQRIWIKESFWLWVVHIDDIICFLNRVYKIVLLFLTYPTVRTISEEITFTIFLNELLRKRYVKFYRLILVLLLAIAIILILHHGTSRTGWWRVEVQIIIKILVVEKATGIIHSIHVEYWRALLLQVYVFVSIVVFDKSLVHLIRFILKVFEALNLLEYGIIIQTLVSGTATLPILIIILIFLVIIRVKVLGTLCIFSQEVFVFQFELCDHVV